jgi:hypothetical protein
VQISRTTKPSFAMSTAATVLVVSATLALICLGTVLVTAPSTLAVSSLGETALAGLATVTDVDGATRVALLQTLAGIAVAATIALEATVRRGQALALELRTGGDAELLAEEVRRLFAVARVEWYSCTVLVSGCLIVAIGAARPGQDGTVLELLIALALATWIVNETRKVHASLAFAHDVFAPTREAAQQQAREFAGALQEHRHHMARRLAVVLVVVLALLPVPLLWPLDGLDALAVLTTAGGWLFVVLLVRSACVDRILGEPIVLTVLHYVFGGLISLLLIGVLIVEMLYRTEWVLVGAAGATAVIGCLLIAVMVGFGGRGPLNLLQELVRAAVARRLEKLDAQPPSKVLLQ